MSYARPQITTRIIPRTENVAVRPGLTVLIGRPESGVTEYMQNLKQHPRNNDMKVITSAFCDKHAQRDTLFREAITQANNGDIVCLEMIGHATIDSALRNLYESGISSEDLRKSLSMIITFHRANGRVTTEVHSVLLNRAGTTRAPRPFVGC